MLPTPGLKDIDYDKVYEPAEDSFLLLDVLELQQEQVQQRFQDRVPVVAEIGTGSGIVTTFIKENILTNSVYLATDVNPVSCRTAMNTVRNNDSHWSLVDSLQMSLTTGIRHHVIDLLVFNPPYVPAEEVPAVPQNEDDSTWLDLALLGGADGMETTWQVLDQLGDILSADGMAYVLFCARNKPETVAETMRQRGWAVETVEVRKAGWEVLSVLRFLRD